MDGMSLHDRCGEAMDSVFLDSPSVRDALLTGESSALDMERICQDALLPMLVGLQQAVMILADHLDDTNA